MPREWALSWPTRIYKPLKQIEPLALILGKSQGHRTHNHWSLDAQTLRPVHQKKPRVNLLNQARWFLMVKHEPPDALKLAPDTSGAHQSSTQKGLQKRTSTGLTREHPVPYSERFAKCRVTGLAAPDSLRASGALSQSHYWSQATPDTRTGSSLRLVLSVRSSTLTMPETEGTSDA